MKKFVFTGLMFFFGIFAFSPSFANENIPSTLYDGGYVQDVLTSRQPSPWSIVKHYVRKNDPKLIAFILTEQGISLSPRAKFPVGMTVRVPQKYVRAELLPSPSAAEKTLADAEHKAELQKQAELFIAELKVKDTQIIGHWIFDALLIVAIIFLVKFHVKIVKKNNDEMDIMRRDREDIVEGLGAVEKQNRALEDELCGMMTTKKSAEIKKVWTPDEIKDALMTLTLREARDLLEWEALTVQREGGGESQIKLKNVPNFLKDKDENLFDIPLQIMSGHKVASASTEKPS